MLRAGASSQQDYEAAKTILATMRADITALNAQIIKAQIEVDKKILDLSYTRITAPMDGTVIAVVTRSGQTVNSSQSTPTIVKLARLDTMTIKVQISEADITRITPGQRVYFTTLSEPDRRYDAILRTIELAPESVMKESAPSSTSDSGSTNNAIYYNALLDVPNPQLKLRIAMTVQVTLILAEVKNALLIPVQALEKVDNKGNRTVRVLDKNNHIAVRQVKTGLTNNIETEITSGLSDGDIIVLAENTEISSTEDNFP